MAREHLTEGQDPSHVKRRGRLQALAAADTFEATANEWYLRGSTEWSESHQATVSRILKKEINPYIGRCKIAELKPHDVLAVLHRMEKRVGDTSRKAKQIADQVFRYGAQCGKCDRDVTHVLKGAIKAKAQKHFGAITERSAIGGLLRVIDSYKGEYATLKALQLAQLVFVRPANLRMMEWSELDIESALWTIPAAKLKLSTEKKRANKPEDAEQVPLSKQTLYGYEKQS